jgi:hypothetical protein
MANLLLIECRESLDGFQHTVYCDGHKVLSVYLPGVIIDRMALEDFRKHPFDFSKRYDLTTVQHFTLKRP